MKYVEVRKLQAEGFSINSIAKKLNMSRNTVKEYIGMAPEEFEDFLISLRNRSKKLDPFRDHILQWLHEHPDLTGAQVYELAGRTDEFQRRCGKYSAQLCK